MHEKGNEQPGDGKNPVRPEYDTHHIDELRKRLYARGEDTPSGLVRRGLPLRKAPQAPSAPVPPPPSVPAEPLPPRDAYESDTMESTMARSIKRTKLRKTVALVGGGFFLLATIISLLIMVLGSNTVSGQNIMITTSGLSAVGGGAEYEFQVAIANQNPVPIQSAVLFVEYPRGTQSVTEAGKEVLVETHRLDVIENGKLVNVPLSARIFGEENEEKQIKVWIEYRVAGSNATFEKQAEPLTLKISTSPVLVSLALPEDISSGQEIPMSITIQSNSPTPLTNVLIKATYPVGFDFTSADTDTLSGEDIWRIDTLNPNEQKIIVIKGLVTGYEGESRVFGVTVGIANDAAASTIASAFATDEETIVLQESALNLRMTIGGRSDASVSVSQGSRVDVVLEYRNEINSTIYNSQIEVELSGSGLEGYDVDARGAYDARRRTIVWEPGIQSELRELSPGDVVRLQFYLEPNGKSVRTPQVQIVARASGGRLPNQTGDAALKGEITRTLKVESAPVLSTQTNYSEGPFVNTGPLPPVVGQVTQYAYLLTAKAGSNDLADAEVTAVIPAGVQWLDLVTSGANISYTPSTRTIRWVIGNVSANTQVTAAAQVSLVPSSAQVGTMPTILETQRLRATDRFTGTTVRVDAPALTTNLGTGLSRVEAN